MASIKGGRLVVVLIAIGVLGTLLATYIAYLAKASPSPPHLAGAGPALAVSSLYPKISDLFSSRSINQVIQFFHIFNCKGPNMGSDDWFISRSEDLAHLASGATRQSTNSSKFGSSRTSWCISGGLYQLPHHRQIQIVCLKASVPLIFISIRPLTSLLMCVLPT